MATSQVATATSTSTKVSCRLLNSISPWIAYFLVGVSDESVHLGQLGQPSPESVSRTAPPVTTITTFAITEARARPRSHGTVWTRAGSHDTGRGRGAGGGTVTEALTPTGTTEPPRAKRSRPTRTARAGRASGCRRRRPARGASRPTTPP